VSIKVTLLLLVSLFFTVRFGFTAPKEKVQIQKTKIEVEFKEIKESDSIKKIKKNKNHIHYKRMAI